MKRLLSNFDPTSNPTDAARGCVDTLNSDITKLHNIVAKWNKAVKLHPDDDTKMNEIVDRSSYMQKEIDNILKHYTEEIGEIKSIYR